MGRYYWRPNFAASVDYGNVDTDGSGPVLGDNSDSTGKKYFTGAGSILTFNLPSPSVVPAGRDIIAVRVGHRQKNDLLVYNGWPRSYLRYNGKRQENTAAYKQDGYSTSAREVLGTHIYNKNLDPWTWDLISLMGAETGAAQGTIGPATNKRWCIVTEVFIQIIWNDPVAVPTDCYPANGAVIDTSSVQFSAKCPASQEEQPVQTVFQVCRVNTFDNDDVRTFIGGLNTSVDANSRSYYVSDVSKDSYTNLGPGVWYVRIKGRDFKGNESAWGTTTSFTISHGPLPDATITDPINAQSVNSPYRVRSARIVTQPSGGRKVGVTWQFAKDAGFTTSVIQWTNTSDGKFIISSSYPMDISYDPTPNASVPNGLSGPKVGAEDPSQYLSQGIWYARVRATDVWGQNGHWSNYVSFTVAHPPAPSALIPSGSASFDPLEAPVRWTFGDPWTNDYQTAYRMQVLDSYNNVLQDTGKIASGLTKSNMNALSQYFRQLLNIKIDTWDADDVKNGTTSQLTGTFMLSRSPVTTILFPANDNDQIPSGQPNIQWSSTFATADISQKSYAIVIKDSSAGNTVYDSGVINSTDTSHLPTRPILKNLTGYQLSLTITDSENLSKTVYRNFSTNFDRPETVTCVVDDSGYNEFGYTEVSWPSGNPDPFFKEWRVYRKKADDPDAAYVLAGIVSNPGIKFFQDWLIAGNDTFVYSVVQAAYRYGSLVESIYNQSYPLFIYTENWWLIVPSNPNLNTKITGVSGDSYTRDREISDYNIIGRGRVRAYGTKYGKTGSLSIKVRHSQNMTASQFVSKLERVCDDQYSLFMRDPFGNVTLIAIGVVSLDRLAGVGSSEFGDVELPYIEVATKDTVDIPTVTDSVTYVESPPGSGLMLAIYME